MPFNLGIGLLSCIECVDVDSLAHPGVIPVPCGKVGPQEIPLKTMSYTE